MCGRARRLTLGASGAGKPGSRAPVSAARNLRLGLALTVASLAIVTASNSAGSATARSNATKVGRPASGRVVALWHMNERSGNVMRDSIHHHNGHLRHVRLGLPGFSRTAYGFNGSSSYVSVPSASGLNPRRQRIAISMHLKARSAPAKPDWDLIRKGYHYNRGGEYLMEYQPSGRASCAFMGSIKRSQLFSRPGLNDGRWHTIKCIKTGHRIQVVVDGRKFSRRVRVGRIGNGAPVVIGARPRSEFFRGSLDEAKIKIG
jgi:hypothetical protein